MYQIQYYDDHLEKWIPASSATYSDIDVAELDKAILAAHYTATKQFRVVDLNPSS